MYSAKDKVIKLAGCGYWKCFVYLSLSLYQAYQIQQWNEIRQNFLCVSSGNISVSFSLKCLCNLCKKF